MDKNQHHPRSDFDLRKSMSSAFLNLFYIIYQACNNQFMDA